jgi:hypothetical protein
MMGMFSISETRARVSAVWNMVFLSSMTQGPEIKNNSSAPQRMLPTSTIVLSTMMFVTVV